MREGMTKQQKEKERDIFFLSPGNTANAAFHPDTILTQKVKY